MINLTFKVCDKLAVRILLLTCLFLFSDIQAAEFHDESLMIGGARADTKVRLGHLSKDPPKSDIVETCNKRRNLPRDWHQLCNNAKGMEAERISRMFFSSLKHTNCRGSEFTTIACDGSYSTVNGYDGLYVVLDSDGAVARFNGINVVKSSSEGDPIIIINESKFSSNGELIFGSGIELEDKTYAVQMSEAWVRIVAHNVLKRVEECRCVISKVDEVCGKVYDALTSIVRGNVQDLRSVFRTATVLDKDGQCSVYALGSDTNRFKKTKNLLEQLLNLTVT